MNPSNDIRIEGARSLAQFVSELTKQGIVYKVRLQATDIWIVNILGF